MSIAKRLAVVLVLIGIMAFALDLVSTSTSAAPGEVSAIESESNSSETSQLLAVPYVSQKDTSWCFESSLDMVLRYWGKDVSLEDIANASGHARNVGNSMLDVFFGWVNSYLAQWPDLAFSRGLWGWGFDNYREMIDQGRPVIASTFGLPGHTIVVVGYLTEDAQDYLYVHDPSGYLSRMKWQTKSVVFARVTWDEFSRMHWTELTIEPH